MDNTTRISAGITLPLLRGGGGENFISTDTCYLPACHSRIC